MFLASSGFLDPRAARSLRSAARRRPRVGPACGVALGRLGGARCRRVDVSRGRRLRARAVRRHVSAVMGGRAAALFIVSALAWTAGFALARGAAGVVWIAALLGLLLRRTDLPGVRARAVLAQPRRAAPCRHARHLSVSADRQSPAPCAGRRLRGGVVLAAVPARRLAAVGRARHLPGGPRMKTRLELAAVTKAFGRHTGPQPGVAAGPIRRGRRA